MAARMIDETMLWVASLYNRYTDSHCILIYFGPQLFWHENTGFVFRRII